VDCLAADLTLDEHWIVVSPIDAERQAVAAAARGKEFLAAQPDHKIILIPAAPAKPSWSASAPHPEVFKAIHRAARAVIDQYRGKLPDPPRRFGDRLSGAGKVCFVQPGLFCQKKCFQVWEAGTVNFPNSPSLRHFLGGDRKEGRPASHVNF